MFEQWNECDTRIKSKKILKYIWIDFVHICIHAYMPQQILPLKPKGVGRTDKEEARENQRKSELIHEALFPKPEEEA